MHSALKYSHSQEHYIFIEKHCAVCLSFFFTDYNYPFVKKSMTLSHNVISSTPHYGMKSNLQFWSRYDLIVALTYIVAPLWVQFLSSMVRIRIKHAKRK